MKRLLALALLFALPSWAASPAVATTNSGNNQTAGTSHTVNLPASIASGDLLIVVFAHKSVTTSPFGSCPAGWTEFGEVLQAAGSTAAITNCYRQADGSEGASMTMSTADSSRMSYASYRITGAENPATQAPEATTATVANSTTPDPPAITPTGGSKDYLFIEGASQSHGRIVSACSTNYATIVGSGPDNGTATNSGMGTCTRALTAASDNPGTMTTTGTGVEEHAIVTIAVHPPAAGGGTTYLGSWGKVW